MSNGNISAALEKKLAALGAFATAHENVVYTPVNGTPYQILNLLLNNPIDHAVTLDVTEQRGLLQISLMYPLGAGRGPAQARAQAIADHFKPAQDLIESGTKVEIRQTVKIGQGYEDSGRWRVPVSVYWNSFS
jgi:hypothetical protein